MQGSENPLVRQIMSTMDDDDVSDIIQQAVDTPDVTAAARMRMLVESGIAYGVESAQEWVANSLASQVDVIRRINVELNQKLIEAAGDDAATAHINNLRQPISKVLKDYLDLVSNIRAMKFNEAFGVPINTYLTRDRSPEALKALPSSGVYMQLGGLCGFIVMNDTAQMECTCPACFTREHMASSVAIPRTFDIARERFGSVDAAALAYLTFAILEEWKRLDSIEAAFGSMDIGDEGTVSAVTNDAIARMLMGGGEH